VKLDARTAEHLRHALAVPGFEDQLARLVEDAIVDVREYLELAMLKTLIAGLRRLARRGMLAVSKPPRR
jgi:hypothetical protein